MSSTSKYDLVVIGGGPGLRAQFVPVSLAKKSPALSKSAPAAPSSNWGCIFLKALLKSAELYNKLQHSEELGITVSGLDYDFSKIIGRSRNVADTMAKGIGFSSKNKVDHIVGTDGLVPGMVEVTDGPDKGKILSADKILIATAVKTAPSARPRSRWRTCDDFSPGA